MIASVLPVSRAPSAGRYANSGNGSEWVPLDIGHDQYCALVDPETAFWSLVRKEQLGEVFGGSRSELWARYQAQAEQFAAEMRQLRFGLQPSAVYFNPTERCNLNCTYCYIPETMRRDGEHMSQASLIDALGRLRDYFHRTLPTEATPQVVFHGAEPLLNRDALFAGIEAFRHDFRFGVQTNGTCLDDEAIGFFHREQVSIGLSLDGATAETANRTRLNWRGQGQYESVLAAMERLRGCDGWSVICTITRENISSLTELVEFLHAREVPTCLLNIVRCTLPTARQVKPDDTEAAPHFIAALERTFELYQETGRKLTVGNFANILLSIVAPTARRLMCDISPCGGGRCFFAVAPNGDLFPCSEFIGLPSFCGGNLFRRSIEEALASDAFRAVTGRRVEDIEPCRHCALRHFCGSPCPAEAHELHGAMDQPGAFCEFYEEQVRYAFRLIADRREEAFLWDGWSEGTTSTFEHIQHSYESVHSAPRRPDDRTAAASEGTCPSGCSGCSDS